MRGADSNSPQRVAVLGSGVAGPTATHVLRRRYDVPLFEADARLDGHAHALRTPDDRELTVDSGFIVYNERTYPNLLRLFDELGMSTQDTEMSMSVRCQGCGLEYAGARRLDGLGVRRGNLVKPRYLRILGEVRRFRRHAHGVLDDPHAADATDRVRRGLSRLGLPRGRLCVGGARGRLLRWRWAGDTEARRGRQDRVGRVLHGR